MADQQQPRGNVVPFAITAEPLKGQQAIRINAQCAGVLSAHIVVPLQAVGQLKQAMDRAVDAIPRVQLTGAVEEAPPDNQAGEEPTQN